MAAFHTCYHNLLLGKLSMSSVTSVRETLGAVTSFPRALAKTLSSLATWGQLRPVGSRITEQPDSVIPCKQMCSAQFSKFSFRLKLLLPTKQLSLMEHPLMVQPHTSQRRPGTHSFLFYICMLTYFCLRTSFSSYKADFYVDVSPKMFLHQHRS